MYQEWGSPATLLRILQAQIALQLWTPSQEADYEIDQSQGQAQGQELQSRDRAVTVAPRQVADTITFLYLHHRLLLSSSSPSSSSSSSLRFLHLAPALRRALGAKASHPSSQNLRAVEKKIAVTAAAVAAPLHILDKSMGQDQGGVHDPLSLLQRTVEILALHVLGYEGWDHIQDNDDKHTTPLSLSSSEPLPFSKPLRLTKPLSLSRTPTPSITKHRDHLDHRVTVPVYLAVLRGLVGVFTEDMGQRVMLVEEDELEEVESTEEMKDQGEVRRDEESKVDQEQRSDKGSGPTPGPVPVSLPASELALALGLSGRPHAPVGQFLQIPLRQRLGQPQTITGVGIDGRSSIITSKSGRSLITHTPSISPTLRTAVRTHAKVHIYH